MVLPGGDRFQFMERNVREADYVLCVCTPEYVKRANERQRGVGVETSLITPRFFEQNQTKTFIPLVRAAELMLRDMADLPGEHPA